MTAQYPDLINYQGKQYPLFSNPLDSYFNEQNPRPDLKALSTANWRGYIAEWEIEDNALYLDNLSGWVGGDHKTYAVNACEIGIENLFHGVFDGPVKATWFSGTLRIPQGELLEYVHRDYESVYDQDILLTIEKGCLVRTKVKTNRPLPRPLRILPWKRYLNYWRFNATDTIILVIAVPVYIIIFPLLVPFKISKSGWNPKNWNLP